MQTDSGPLILIMLAKSAALNRDRSTQNIVGSVSAVSVDSIITVDCLASVWALEIIVGLFDAFFYAFY
jgi:hypothetical protein